MTLLHICIYSVERLIREHCHIDGDDLINYEGRFGSLIA